MRAPRTLDWGSTRGATPTYPRLLFRVQLFVSVAYLTSARPTGSAYRDPLATWFAVFVRSHRHKTKTNKDLSQVSKQCNDGHVPRCAIVVNINCGQFALLIVR